MNKVIILLAAAIFLAGCYKDSQVIDSEVSRPGISVVGPPTQIELELPKDFSGSDWNWGLNNIACSEGGYNLSKYAGKNVTIDDYSTNESLSGIRLHKAVITENNNVICVFFYTENSEDGVYPANFTNS